jgi:hypothetical protein
VWSGRAARKRQEKRGWFDKELPGPLSSKEHIRTMSERIKRILVCTSDIRE